MISEDFDFEEVRRVAEALVDTINDVDQEDQTIKGASLMRGIALITGWIIAGHPQIKDAEQDRELVIRICNQLVMDIAWSVNLHLQSDNFKAEKSLCIPIPPEQVEQNKTEGTPTEFVDLTKSVRKNTIH